MICLRGGCSFWRLENSRSANDSIFIYANYAEANKALWRQTVVPLVGRVAAALEHWLAPAFDTPFRLVPDLNGIEALSEDKALMWKRVTEADFLSDAEKRRLMGMTQA